MKFCKSCGIEKPLIEFKQRGDKKGLYFICRECTRAKDKERYYRNREKRLKEAKDYWEKVKETRRGKRKEYYSQYMTKEKRREKYLKDYSKNKDRYFSDATKRRAVKLKANPGWDKELTDFVVKEATVLVSLRNTITNIKWHVDHIVPLRGKLVCGLHVWNNFAVIPALLNLRKHNNFEVT